MARSTTAKRSLASSPVRRSEGKQAPPAEARPHKKTAHAAVDRAALIQGMQAIQPRVKECYRRYRKAGVANTSIAVGADGKVDKVTVTGPLARSRTAACVKAAVMTARFRGGGITFQYPLVLP